MIYNINILVTSKCLNDNLVIIITFYLYNHTSVILLVYMCLTLGSGIKKEKRKREVRWDRYKIHISRSYFRSTPSDFDQFYTKQHRVAWPLDSSSGFLLIQKVVSHRAYQPNKPSLLTPTSVQNSFVILDHWGRIWRLPQHQLCM